MVVVYGGGGGDGNGRRRRLKLWATTTTITISAVGGVAEGCLNLTATRMTNAWETERGVLNEMA